MFADKSVEKEDDVIRILERFEIKVHENQNSYDLISRRGVVGTTLTDVTIPLPLLHVLALARPGSDGSLRNTNESIDQTEKQIVNAFRVIIGEEGSKFYKDESMHLAKLYVDLASHFMRKRKLVDVSSCAI